MFGSERYTLGLLFRVVYSDVRIFDTSLIQYSEDIIYFVSHILENVTLCMHGNDIRMLLKCDVKNYGCCTCIR